jgi:hypothetical protein
MEISDCQLAPASAGGLGGWAGSLDAMTLTRRPVPDEPLSTRGPVGHPGSARHLTVLVVAFVVTVTGTRLFLALTGYPRIGGTTYHLAHALWGGLLLIVAVVTMLLWANRWALQLGAVLAGVGVGLFIDEVGKFITTSNDYFFPLAAPIVYLAMVLLAWIAYRSRRRHVLTDRERLYDILDGLQDLADGRLDSDRRTEIIAHLGHLRDEWDRPELRDLSARLEEFLLSPVVTVLPPRPGLLDRLHSRLLRLEERLVPEIRLRRLVSLLMITGTVLLTVNVVVTLVVLVDPAMRNQQLHETVGGTALDPTLVAVVSIIRLGGSVVGWVLYLAATTSWFRGRRLHAVRLAVAAQLISLSLIDVMESYVDQFAVLPQSVFDLVLLSLVLRYRVRFLPRTPSTADPGR